MKLLKTGFKDSLFYFIGDAGSKLIVFLVIPLLNHFFSVEDFGRYDLFLITVNFIVLIIGLGYDSGFSIFITENRSNKNLLGYLYTRSLGISLGFFIIISLMGYVVNLFTKTFNNLEFLFLILYVLAIFVSGTVFNFLRWLGEAKSASLVNFVTALFSTFMGFSLVYFSQEKKLEDFFLGLVVGAFIGMFINLALAKDYLCFKKVDNGYSKLIELTKVSIHFVPTYLSNYLVSYSDRFLILFFIGDLFYVGLYALLYRIAQLGRIGLSVISKGFLPVMYANYATEEGKLFNKKIFNLFNIVLIPLFVVVYFVKDILITIMGNKNALEFLNYSYLLPIMFVATMVFGGLSINGFGYTIKRKTKYISIITLSGAILNITLAMLLMPYFGFSAIIYSTLIASLLTALSYSYYSEKLYSFNYNFKLISISFLILAISSAIIIYFNN